MNSPHRPKPAPKAAAKAASEAATTPEPKPDVKPLQEAELQELDELLAEVPAPLQPLDLTALDGFLAGVLLQPQRIPPSRWLPFVTDDEGRALPASWPARMRLQSLIRQRHAELDALMEARQWFDPWLTDVEEDTMPAEAVQPWVLGFATACGEFPALTEGPGSDEPELIEALAQVYQHLDPADLEDADALLAEIDNLEPPASMEEAIESLVRGCLLLADVSRPVRSPARAAPAKAVKTSTQGGRGSSAARPRRRY